MLTILDLGSGQLHTSTPPTRRMDTGLLLTVLLCLMADSGGLELSLSRDIPATPGARALCGVLHCEEKTHAANASTRDDNTVASEHAVAIRSMEVFKHDRKYSNDDDERVAFLNVMIPTLTRVSNGIKAHGVLTAERATIRLELAKAADCLSEFTCKVRVSGHKGKELVSSSRLLQQPEPTAGSRVDYGNMASMVTLQLLTLVQQLDVKLALVTTSVERLEGKMESQQTQFADKIESQQNHFADKIDSLHGDMESLQTRMEDKIESRIVDKLCQLETKVSERCYDDPGLIKSELNQRMADGFLTLKQQFDNGQDQALASIADLSESVEEKSNLTSARLAEMETALYQLETQVHADSLTLKSVARGIDGTFNVSKAVRLSVDSNAAVTQDKLRESLEQLETYIDNRTSNTHSIVRAIFSEANSTTVRGLESALTAILKPRSCSRGMVSLPTQGDMPYPVVYPGAESGMGELPFLCDTITDGGGWIIIQRRTSGNVDFYRDWATYKHGFGTWDEEFWLGNEQIHALTSSGHYELRVELRYKGKSAYARYSSFSLADESHNYTLSVGTHSGTAGDNLSFHNGKPFSTRDRDNGGQKTDCAARYGGGWWYRDLLCLSCNLNGGWGQGDWKGPTWISFTDRNPVSYSEMKIRRL